MAGLTVKKIYIFQVISFLIIILLGSTVSAANRIYYENFDDQSIATPPYGKIMVCTHIPGPLSLRQLISMIQAGVVQVIHWEAEQSIALICFGPMLENDPPMNFMFPSGCVTLLVLILMVIAIGTLNCSIRIGME